MPSGLLSGRSVRSSTPSRWRWPRSSWPMRRAGHLARKKRSLPSKCRRRTTAATAERPDHVTSGQATGRDPRRGRRATAGTTRLFVGIGRSGGVRPQDLVGAIAGESHLSGRDIGAIEIADRFSLVEVPESAADEVVRALRGTSIKGQKATVRRERFPAR